MQTEKIIETLKGLISINSVTNQPTYKYIRFIKKILSKSNFEIEELGEKRFKNLIIKNSAAKEYDKQDKKYIALCGHIDTVPFKTDEWNTNPLELTRIDNKLFGLGSSDMKGPISVMLNVIIDLNEKNPDIPLCLILTYNEEEGLCGARYLVKNHLDKINNLFLIIGEPTRLQLAHSHKGCADYKLTIKGKSAHSSNPSNGLSAINAAGFIIDNLKKLNEEYMNQEIKHYSFGSTINIGMIKGGDAVNMVPDHVEIICENRIAPGSSDKSFISDIEKIFNELTKQSYECTYKQIGCFFPFYIEPETDTIKKICSISGCNPITVNFTTDASAFNGLGDMPCIILGPGDISVCHRPNEYIKISELKKAYDTYINILSNLDIIESLE